MVEVESLLIGDNYNYLVREPKSGDLAVVDLANGQLLIKELLVRGAKPTHVFLTHFHFDHVAGLEEFCEAFEGVTVVKPLSEDRITQPAVGLAHLERYRFGFTEVEVLITSAHTRTHAAYIFDERHCFTGDALFMAGCGRLFEGQAEDLKKAMDLFAGLDPDTQLYFGHEYSLANLRFAEYVDPGNRDVALAKEAVEAKLNRGEHTVPGNLAQELKINPFLRTDQAQLIQMLDPSGRLSPTERLMALRRKKDHF
ncbi:MAG: hydroxyacylglutathione hydrolase [bacterium]|nr:hydroxyacylglutathione hydrolase [bacterium]